MLKMVCFVIVHHTIGPQAGQEIGGWGGFGMQ